MKNIKLRCKDARFCVQLRTFYVFFFVCHTDTTAELKLKKPPTQDKTFSLPITVKDKAGVGVPQAFEGESHL